MPEQFLVMKMDEGSATFGVYDTPEEAWGRVDSLREFYPYISLRVVGITPVPRPVPPRPVADRGGIVGCYYKYGMLRDPSGLITELLYVGEDIIIAAELWEKHQQWLENGGQDDAPVDIT